MLDLGQGVEVVVGIDEFDCGFVLVIIVALFGDKHASIAEGQRGLTPLHGGLKLFNEFEFRHPRVRAGWTVCARGLSSVRVYISVCAKSLRFAGPLN